MAGERMLVIVGERKDGYWGHSSGSGGADREQQGEYEKEPGLHRGEGGDYAHRTIAKDFWHFVPEWDTEPVRKIHTVLGLDKIPFRIPIKPAANARYRNCYDNVFDRIQLNKGGKMRLGWVVFQHGYLYIEATPHAVYDPNDGGPWEACTPMTLQNGEDVKIILFFSDDRRSYDFNTRTEPNRVVVPVTVDPSFLRSLRSQSEYLAVWNAEKPGESPIRPNAMDRLRSENQKDKLFGRARRRAKEAESEESDS